MRAALRSVHRHHLPTCRYFTTRGHIWTPSQDHLHGLRKRALATDSANRSVPEQAEQRKRSPDIHILGIGNIGKFVAHSLSTAQGTPPIHLLWTNPLYEQHWREEGQRIRMLEYDDDFSSSGYRLELAPDPSNREPIDNLIICSKAGATVKGVQNIRDRLHPKSSILFLQNGMGMIEDVTAAVFPKVEDRPWYSIGVTTHGVYSQTSWTIVHAGFGTTHSSTLPRAITHSEETTAPIEEHPGQHTISQLLMSPTLTGVELPYEKMIQFQWEKLAINAVINPITALLNCRNGDVGRNIEALELGFEIVSEISAVVLALPELQGLPYLKDRFQPDRLMDAVSNVAYDTAYNVSSMLQDVKATRPTEIEYINAYVARKGDALGIPCPVNRTMAEMVRARTRLGKLARKDFIPVVGEPRHVDAAENHRKEMRRMRESESRGDD